MKRIIIQTGQGANYYIRQSLVNGFRLCGYEVYFWDESGKSPFDAFGEFNPDLFIGSTWQLSRAIIKCLSARPECKVILYGDVFGEIQQSIDLVKYPVGIATDEQKDNVGRLIKAGGNLKNIISNHGRNDVDYTHGWWNEFMGLDVHSVLVSADITQYYPRPADENYKVQLAFCGGYWAYKARNLDQYILPLLYPNTQNWRIRLFGGGWNLVQSLGNISNEEMARHYTNASIIPHVVEPHASEIYSDIPLRYMETAACQGFGISCPCVGIREVFNENELVVADDPKDFFDRVVYYLNRPEETQTFRWNAYKQVMNNHTCLHRVLQLLTMVNENTTVVYDALTQMYTSNKLWGKND